MIIDLQVFILLLTLIFLLLLLISLYFKKKYIIDTFYFKISLYFTILWIITSIINHVTQIYQLALISNKISYASSVLALIFLTKFIDCFINSKYSNMIKDKIIFVFGILIALLTIFTDFIVKDVFLRTDIQPESIESGMLFHLYAIFIFFLGFYVLYKLYKGIALSKGLKKIQLSYIFIGIIISFSISSLFSVILPIFGIKNLSFLSPLTVIIYLIFFYFSIIRYRFLDVKLFLIYGLETILLILLSYFFFYLIVFIDELLFGSVYTSEAVALGIVYSIAFIISLKLISNTIYKKLIEPYFSYESFSLELNKLIGKTLSKKKLGIIIAKFLKTRLDCEKILVLCELNTEKKQSKLFKIINTFNNFNYQNFSSNLSLTQINKLFNKNTFSLLVDEISVLTNLDEDSKNELILKLKKFQIELIIKLVIKEKNLIGFMFLGPKIEIYSFSEQEIKIIENVAVPFAMALQRAFLYSEVKNFALTLKSQVEAATKELMEKYQQEKDMIGIMGHELRTPMTIAKTSSELLLQKLKITGSLDNAYLEDKLNKIYKSILKESDLIQTLLSTSHIDNSKVNLQPEEIDLSELLNDAIEAYKNDIDQKNLYLKIENNLSNNLIVNDPQRLQEIINNLISNAIKYTFKGGITISINEDKKFIYFDVKDTGVGIPKDEIPKIGLRFHRVHQHLDDKGNVVRSGGTGLGMYVVKGLLKAMGGELLIESELAVGSTFTAKFPKYLVVDSSNISTDLNASDIKTDSYMKNFDF